MTLLPQEALLPQLLVQLAELMLLLAHLIQLPLLVDLDIGRTETIVMLALELLQILFILP